MLSCSLSNNPINKKNKRHRPNKKLKKIKIKSKQTQRSREVRTHLEYQYISETSAPPWFPTTPHCESTSPSPPPPHVDYIIISPPPPPCVDMIISLFTTPHCGSATSPPLPTLCGHYSYGSQHPSVNQQCPPPPSPVWTLCLWFTTPHCESTSPLHPPPLWTLYLTVHNIPVWISNPLQSRSRLGQCQHIICWSHIHSPASPVHSPASPVHSPASPVHSPASPVHSPASPVHTLLKDGCHGNQSRQFLRRLQRKLLDLTRTLSQTVKQWLLTTAHSSGMRFFPQKSPGRKLTCGMTTELHHGSAL